MMQVSSSTSAEGRNHPEYMAAAASKGHGKSSIVLKLGAHYLVRCLGIWSVDGSWGSSWRDTADVEEFFLTKLGFCTEYLTRNTLKYVLHIWLGTYVRRYFVCHRPRNSSLRAEEELDGARTRPETSLLPR